MRSAIGRLIPRSLKTKFMILAVPVVLIVVLMFLVVAEYLETDNRLRFLDEKIHKYAEIYSILLAQPGHRGDVEALTLVIGALLSDDDVAAVEVQLPVGTRFGRFGDPIEAFDPAYVHHATIDFVTEEGEVINLGRLSVAGAMDKIHREMVNRILRDTVLGAALLLVIVIGIYATMQKTVIRPLTTLLHRINNPQSTGPDIEWHSDDEIGRLIQAFNAAQARQNDYEEQLRTAQDELERRVEERTRELQAAHRAAEEAMRRVNTSLEQIEAASRAKSDFLANVSHELRTPLNAIIGFTDVIDMGLFGELENDRYRSYVKDIQGSARHLLSIIDEILDISRIEAGKLETTESELSLTSVIAEVLHMIAGAAEEAGLSIEAPERSDLPHLIADERLLKQMLLNLLSNAVKFTEPGGRISVAVETEDDRLILSISDTGIGIPGSEIEKILEPFHQVSAPSTNSASGTGLGLALTRRFIELHGGKIAVESNLGQGTRVSLFFPRSRILDHS